MDQDLREILLRSSNVENDDENHRVRTLTEKNLKIAPVKLEESGKILEKDLWVRAH